MLCYIMLTLCYIMLYYNTVDRVRTGSGESGQGQDKLRTGPGKGQDKAKTGI